MLFLSNVGESGRLAEGPAFLWDAGLLMEACVDRFSSAPDSVASRVNPCDVLRSGGQTFLSTRLRYLLSKTLPIQYIWELSHTHFVVLI